MNYELQRGSFRRSYGIAAIKLVLLLMGALLGLYAGYRVVVHMLPPKQFNETMGVPLDVQAACLSGGLECQGLK